MTIKESKQLRIGDRVTWVTWPERDRREESGVFYGTVIETGYAYNKISWDDDCVTIVAHDNADLMSAHRAER